MTRLERFAAELTREIAAILDVSDDEYAARSASIDAAARSVAERRVREFAAEVSGFGDMKAASKWAMDYLDEPSGTTGGERG